MRQELLKIDNEGQRQANGQKWVERTRTNTGYVKKTRTQLLTISLVRTNGREKEEITDRQLDRKKKTDTGRLGKTETKK